MKLRWKKFKSGDYRAVVSDKLYARVYRHLFTDDPWYACRYWVVTNRMVKIDRIAETRREAQAVYDGMTEQEINDTREVRRLER